MITHDWCSYNFVVKFVFWQGFLFCMKFHGAEAAHTQSGEKEGGAEEHVEMTLAIISIGVHCFVCGFTSGGLTVSLPAFSIRAGMALFCMHFLYCRVGYR